MRRLLLLLFPALVLASSPCAPALAQFDLAQSDLVQERALAYAAEDVVAAEPAYPAPDDDLVREVPRTRRAIEAEIARLERERAAIHAGGSELAVEMGGQLMIYGILLTLIGAGIEAIAQSISSDPWGGLPLMFLAAGGAGGGLAAIGVPLFSIALCDPGYRRSGRASRRIHALRQEAFGLPPDPALDPASSAAR
jgi:hypothetical protein